MASPAERFQQANPATVTPIRARTVIVNRPDHRTDECYWVARRASAVGVVWVNWQQVCCGAAAAGSNIDVWVTDQVMQYSTATIYCAPRNAPTEGRSARSEPRSLRPTYPQDECPVSTDIDPSPITRSSTGPPSVVLSGLVVDETGSADALLCLTTRSRPFGGW
jgi:hypothetical protein